MTGISIIIPAYNKANYIADTLDSCKNQSFCDYEIIIVDDCSSDNTFQIINIFASENSTLSIRILQNETNKGVSFSRNRGMQVAAGNYLLFLDADDILHPEALSVLWNAVKLNTDYIIPGRKYFYQDISFDALPEITDLVISDLIFPTSVIVGGLIRKNILDQHQLCFEEDMKNGEDTLFSSCLFCFSIKRTYLDFPLYLIRRNMNNSLSKGQWNNPNMEIPRERSILQYMKKYYESGRFTTGASKAEAIKVIRRKKNSIKELLCHYCIREFPEELKYRISLSEILGSQLGLLEKTIEVLYLLPGMESITIFKILMRFRRNEL